MFRTDRVATLGTHFGIGGTYRRITHRTDVSVIVTYGIATCATGFEMHLPKHPRTDSTCLSGLDTVIAITAVTVDRIVVASNVATVYTRDAIRLTECAATSRAFIDVGGAEHLIACLTVGRVFMTMQLVVCSTSP
jgi:hypothetical protein